MTCHRGKDRFDILIDLFEAFLGLDNHRASQILEEISDRFISPIWPNLTYFIHRTAKMIQRNAASTTGMQQEILDLLNKPLAPDFFSQQGNIHKADEDLILVAETLALFDQEKAINILNIMLNESNFQKWKVKVKMLITIAEAFAKFDQKRAFEIAQRAYDEIEGNPCWSEEDDLEDDDLLDFQSRIINIFTASDKEYASKVLLTSFDKRCLANDKSKDAFFEIGGVFGKFFMRNIDTFAILDRQKAYETVKLCVQWANQNHKIPYDLFTLSKVLSKSFPDEALEIAELLEDTIYKCRALNLIVSQGIESNLAKSYVENVERDLKFH